MKKKTENNNSAVDKTEKIASENADFINPFGEENKFVIGENVNEKSANDENSRQNEAERKRLAALKKDEVKKQKKLDALKEKEEKRKARQLKKADAAMIKQERLNEKRKHSEQKRLYRRENRKNGNGYGGWLAAVISLGAAVIVLGGLLTFVAFSPVDDYINTSANEERNFYDLVGYVDSIDTNLSKIMVSADEENIQKLLQEVRIQSNLATESLSNLSIRDEEKYYTTKFINQVGDFSKYLTDKLISGNAFSDKDCQTLNKMYSINKNLKQELYTIASNIDDSFDFKSIYEDKKDNLLISGFSKIESSSVDYPHMIYDGAFSDGTESDKAQALEGLKEIKKIQGEKIVKDAFAAYGISNIRLTGETTGAVIETYNYDGDLADGTLISITVSKKGGKIINFNNFKQAEEIKYDAKNCQSVAEKFLSDLGFSGMKAVWMTEGASVDTYNFAYFDNGVIFYPDLVKVNVCRERGIVCSMEAKSYYLNHTKRSVGDAKITVEQARNKVSDKIEIESERLCVIPRVNGAEALAYEFCGKYDGETYYVYIDAISGKEADIFKVVKTTEGNLLA